MTKNLNTASEDAFGLLQNLLQWSQSQKNQLMVVPELLRIPEVAGESVRLVQPNAEKKDIRIVPAIPDDITLQSDRNMLQTILRNLLANAVKFSHIPSTIDLNISRADKGLLIIVKDHGVGIPREKLKYVFTLSLKSTNGTCNESGTGLGLVLCKEFVTRLGGTITVDSEEGKGCMFTLFLPDLPLAEKVG
jgi:signal transduction histidine kinase